MKKMKQLIMVLLVSIALAFVGLGDLLAKGGSSSRSGGSSRSSSSSKSYSRPSSSKPSSSSKSSSKSTKPSSSSRSTSAPKRTPSQQKAYEAAKKNGTASMSKTQAVNKFKSDPSMKTKYTSKYTTQPTTRPSHIPQSTTVGGKSYNVTYNSQYGGYGYMGPSGAWIMYDAMADAAMLSMLMNQNHYYYQGHPSLGSTTVVHHRSAGWTIFWVIIGVCALAGFIIWIRSLF